MRYATLLSAIFPVLVASVGTRGHLANGLPDPNEATKTHSAPPPSGTDLPGWWDVGPRSDSGDIRITDNVQYQYMVVDWLVDACTVQVTCANGAILANTDQHPLGVSAAYLPVCTEAGNYVVRVNADCD